VELCAARDCSRVLATMPGRDGQGAFARDLPVGRVYWRLNAGSATSATWALDVRPPAPAEGAAPEQGAAGDLSGDRFADLFVARTEGPPPRDAALLYRGTATGIEIRPRDTFTPGAGRPGMSSGRRLPRGDVDGNGWPDLVDGAQVTLGSRTGLGRAIPLGGGDVRLVIVADVNGDGRDDVVRAQPYAETSVEPAAGQLLVHFGAPDGVAREPSQTIVPPASEVRLLGAELARAGDVDGDGYDDILVTGELPVGASGFDHPLRLVLLRGGREGLAWSRATSLGPDDGAAPPWVAQWLVAEGIGDRDGDGYDDLAVLERAAAGRGGDGNRVRLRLYRGGPRGPRRDGDGIDVTLGTGLAPVGDLDGDGLADLVLFSPGEVILMPGAPGAPAQRAPLRARAAASPGDIDADGFGDLAVAVDGGQVQVYFGRAASLFAPAPGALLVGPEGAMDFGAWVE